MKFWRYLNVGSNDHAKIYVSNDKTNWTQLWENLAFDLTDNQWIQVVFDISSIAANQATVYIKFTMGPTDSLKRFSGWNIDDLEVTSDYPDPRPDIKANNSEGPVTVPRFSNLSIEVSLDPGDYTGVNADWWALVNTSWGWYHYDLSSKSWIPGMVVTHQGPLFNLSPFQVFSGSGLPAGTYTFYFGVDMKMNGSLGMDQIYYDSVSVTVTQ